ncbi:MAG: hypothetical protein RLZZ274_160 [Cyanobacteriota bacterium]|jgi:hypothetical protein
MNSGRQKPETACCARWKVITTCAALHHHPDPRRNRLALRETPATLLYRLQGRM